MKNIITWLSPSLEGNDGKASARALTNAWYVGLNTGLTIAFVVLIYIIVLSKESDINENAYTFMKLFLYLIGVYLTCVLLLFGVITFANIIQTARVIKGQPEPVEVTTTTETKIKTNGNEETTNTSNSNSSI